jgi:hypothetical protein
MFPSTVQATILPAGINHSGHKLLHTKLFYCMHSKPPVSSTIQTLLLVLEFHQISHFVFICAPDKNSWVADYTASREFHPAPKNFSLFTKNIVALFLSVGNR